MTSLALKSAYGLKILSNKHKAIHKIREQANIPEIYGDKIWCSSYFIMDHFLKNPITQKSKVIEIGCGSGILSIFCTKEFDSKVIGVDADSNVILFLQVHAKKNEMKIKTKVCRYENLKPKLLAGQDLIVGGDICFWDELVEPLFKLIRLAMRQQIGKIIIADLGRTPFLKLAKCCQKKYKAELIPVSTRKKDGCLLVING
jgi:predicted nicotinamide N-methyase